MDTPMCFSGNKTALVPGMVMFLHMILMDPASGTAMTLGRTSVVTDAAPEILSRAGLELLRA
jgi:Xaa-Pro dipeptidase